MADNSVFLDYYSYGNAVLMIEQLLKDVEDSPGINLYIMYDIACLLTRHLQVSFLSVIVTAAVVVAVVCFLFVFFLHFVLNFILSLALTCKGIFRKLIPCGGAFVNAGKQGHASVNEQGKWTHLQRGRPRFPVMPRRSQIA